MQNHRSPAVRELGCFIAALRKQWLEELGTPEAAATEAVLRNAETLLRAARGPRLAQFESDLALARFLGADWLYWNPWAGPHVQKLRTALAGGGDAAADREHSADSAR